VRTAGFRNLNPASLIELCCESSPEARVVGGEDLELLSQVTGRSYGAGTTRKRSLGSAGVLTAGEEDGDEEAEDDGMDVN
jgi:hypothetical protein